MTKIPIIINNKIVGYRIPMEDIPNIDLIPEKGLLHWIKSKFKKEM